MSIFNFLRVNRAGKIAGNKKELSQLERQSYHSDEDKKRIKKLAIKIAKDEERQKIASEKATRTTNKVVNIDNSKEFTSQIGINNAKTKKSK